MISRALLLVSERGPIAPGNHLLYANALLRRGVDVSIGDVNSVHARLYVVKVEAARICKPLALGDRVDALTSEPVSIADFDVVWVMSPPHPVLALDVYQLLWMAQNETPFVNEVQALLLLNNKNILGALVPPGNLIPTNVDSHCENLWTIFEASDHDWVIKPSNFGAGGDVFVLRKGDSNAHALLQSGTGNTHVHAAMMESGLLGLKRRFCILQKFESRAHLNEKRVLIAGGQPFIHYRKIVAPGEHRGNLVQGGAAELCELSPDEHVLCATLGETLMRHGVRFAGADMAYPYFIEINILNPAGTKTILEIGRADMSDRGIELIFEGLAGHGASGPRKNRPAQADTLAQTPQ